MKGLLELGRRLIAERYEETAPIVKPCELDVLEPLPYELKARARDPERQSARARRDAVLTAHIGRVWREHRENGPMTAAI